MTKNEKRLEKFLKNPGSLKYNEIESILYLFGFIKVEAKGSHKKFKHKNIRGINIPVHNNDCKLIYKTHVAKILQALPHDE